MLYALTILSVIAVVVSENRNPVKSLAWVTVLLVVPVVGLVLYIVFGRNIQNKRIISRKNRRKLRRLGAGGDIDPRRIKQPERVLPLIRWLIRFVAQAITMVTELRFSITGATSSRHCWRISPGPRFINMQYYIIADDVIGTRVMDALVERARAGVKVRLIYDHVGSFKLKKRSLRRMRDAGIEAYPFFKVVFPPFGTRINWRNHRKIVVIDGDIGYIGGDECCRPLSDRW